MQRLHINRLRIEVETEEGLYGADFSFSEGLNIIHADNTHGKSTCIQSLVFALGLEGSLGPSRNKPLKPVLTRELRNETGQDIRVISTTVFLQITNHKGRELTLERSSETSKIDLIKVRECSIEDLEEITVNYQNFHVRQAGSATNDKGFHHFLADFLGLELPIVQKFNGEKSPLYLEAIFAANYVEQIRGWGGILNVLPTYLQIRDLSQRVIEFNLGLDILDLKQKRQFLLNEKSDIERKWAFQLDNLKNVASNLRGAVSNRLPESISKKTIIDSISYIYLVDENNVKKTIEEKKDELEKKLSDIKESELIENALPKDVIKNLESDLEKSNRDLRQASSAYELLREALSHSRSYIESIETRISRIDENLRKYNDINKLKKVGSTLELFISDQQCPTCLSPIEDSLISFFETKKHKVLSVDENTKYLKKQRKTYEQVLSEEVKRIETKENQLVTAYEKVKDLRSQVREIKQQLFSINPSYDRSKIKEEAVLEYEVDRINAALKNEKVIKAKLEDLVEDWLSNNSALSKIPPDSFSITDRKKLSRLEGLFKENLEYFGYHSGRIDAFKISTQSYKPMLEDVEISSEASASDNIRIIWSYLYSLLMIDAQPELETNHLGLLIMDEPRQQDAKIENFESFLDKYSEVKACKKQIILGTSENGSKLMAMLEGKDVKLHHFESDIIKKLSTRRLFSDGEPEALTLPGRG
ncbi:hypothetical protein [Marinobacter alexandrii]|jgi:hypothetical protein|uniref:hypothetical protein n=1 Tax=Marinobacter alexandrii TaxID=2570351 RepID=UPI002ABD757D|nr:hypothetical protein [Marinobacter alexandrii]